MKVLKVLSWIGGAFMLLFIAAIECLSYRAIIDDKFRDEMRQVMGD